MKRLNLFILIFIVFIGFGFGDIPADSEYFVTVLAPASPITVSGTWQNVGTAVKCTSSDGILWWTKCTAGTSTGFQFRVLAQVDLAGTLKPTIGIFDIAPALVTVDNWLIQVSAAALALSEIPPFETKTNRKIYYYQLQVQVLVVGGGAGTLDYVYATK